MRQGIAHKPLIRLNQSCTLSEKREIIMPTSRSRVGLSLSNPWVHSLARPTHARNKMHKSPLGQADAETSRMDRVIWTSGCMFEACIQACASTLHSNTNRFSHRHWIQKRKSLNQAQCSLGRCRNCGFAYVHKACRQTVRSFAENYFCLANGCPKKA